MGDDSRIPIEMCYRRAWIYQGVGVSESLNIIWEEIMRWRICKLMRYILLGVKVELVSMEECWYHPRGKGFGSNVCVGV